jgi:exosortase A
MDATSPEKKADTDAAVPTKHRVDNRFALVLMALSLIALFAIFRDTALSFIPIWNTESFGHGYLIIPISLFLFWLGRRRVLQAPVRPSLFGLALMVGAATVWGLGEVADVNLVRQAAFVAMIQCLFLTVLGGAVARVAIFPLGYLVFAIPFGEFLIPYLQDLTAWFAVGALRALGVPVFIDGIFIQTPAGSYLVAEACAGSRYLLSTLAVSVLAAGLFFTSWHKRLLFIAAGVVVSIVANAVRAAGVILLAYWIDPSLAGPVHITYGLVFVAIITLIYLMVGSSYKERSIGEYSESQIDGRSMPSDRLPASNMAAVGIAIGAVACVAAVFGYVQFALSRGSDAVAISPEAPAAHAPWAKSDTVVVGWSPYFAGVTSVAFQSYRDDDRTADLYIGLYASQRRGAELINHANRLEGDLWGRAGSGAVDIDLAQRRFKANYVRLLPQRFAGNTSDVSGRIVWYWYWIDGQFTANPLWAKVLEVKTVLFGGGRAAAIIAVAADYKDRPVEAADTLHGFLESLEPLKPVLERALLPAQAGSGG